MRENKTKIAKLLAEKTDAMIETLIEDNGKIAAEIALLKINVEETAMDNLIIKRALDMKQSEWTKVQYKKTSGDRKTTVNCC